MHIYPFFFLQYYLFIRFHEEIKENAKMPAVMMASTAHHIIIFTRYCDVRTISFFNMAIMIQY